MGLIDDSPERWANFKRRVQTLNSELRKEKAEAKVFFFARHGQGWHNVAEAKYGTIYWDEVMSKKYGDDEITWGPDPELTEIGVNQANEAKDGWRAELPFDITLPEKLYSSPLTRAMDTLRITFDGNIMGDVKDKREVVILENCREENGIHTCDKRRSRSWIHGRFPEFTFEKGFEEEDVLWDPDVRENKTEVADRARKVLDYIFDKDTSLTYISVTAHGGIINGFLQAIGRQPFALATGGFDLQLITLQILPGFGLLDKTPQRWLNLKQKIQELNDSAKLGESFKLLFFCRHDMLSHWARINGDREITWGPDSDLTIEGVNQALHIKNEWEKELSFGIPALDKIYTSPLTRALKTCNIAFGGMKKDHCSVPILVVENCREENGVHTYDKRRSRTYITRHFPTFHIEDGFSEEDRLWLPDARETKAQMAVRAQSVLDMIFDEQPALTREAQRLLCAFFP
ncbi:hypothetical protein NP233_g6866 [Leucocoprinus birnbaumii]|uniref:Phosphoglycerate mutase n=1 Tax=Leucocoprinus birnbaumii TaxID=56174 RepID=A0AAD5VQ98_9AGAR|nr:hypothetical protein NP233_g6866 [Leucocoprinus birnbaumii]